MRLLKNIQGSVLWLFIANSVARENLSREAHKRGINPKRLVFADRVSHPEYLARLQLADLFLDCFNYNAGATANDALWVGLPVLTMIGHSYTARMAGSLLTALSLPELITTTKEEYENRALDLAKNPAQLAKIKNTLRSKRNTEPLFDSNIFARRLEIAYREVYKRYFYDKEPDHVYI